jgi:acyl-CoA thioester hydrolase
MTTDAGSLGVEVWRGGVNPWECDAMGHLNVRFYMTRMTEAMVGAAAALGMPHAYAPGASATLMIREQHIRFLREARPGARLHMRAGVLGIEETEALLLLALYHTQTGEPSATWTTRVSHITAGEARPFPWTRQTLERVGALMVEAPAYAAPRSLSAGPIYGEASLERAKALGLTQISLGALRPQDCDPFGRMGAEQFVARVSDGVSQIATDVRAIIAEQTGGPPERVGGAVLEYRLAYLDWPRAGDRVAIWSGLARSERNVHHYAHWMLDPETGKPWGVAASVAASFDLDTRRIIPVAPAAHDRLQAIAIRDLAP